MRAAAAFTALLVALQCVVELGQDWPLLLPLHYEIGWWGPVAALIGLCIIVVRRGRPRGIAQITAFLALCLVLIEVNLLSMRSELRHACWIALDLLLRLGIAAGWVVACGGLVAVAMWLRRRVSARRAPVWVRWWFATTIFITLTEAGTRVIERPLPDPVVELPEYWSSNRRSADEFRIVAIGGSTMLGFPYQPKVDIATICRARLASRFPDRTFTVENVALNGINLQRAISELRRVPTRPDLILLYTGHNEVFFDVDIDAIRPESNIPLLDVCFDWSSAYRAFSRITERRYFPSRKRLSDGQRLFDSRLFSDRVARQRLERFRQTLAQFARSARHEGIDMIWFVPAYGEGTFEPNRSYSRVPLSEERQAEILGQLAAGRRLERAERWPDAEQVYRALLSDDPGFAEIHFRLAEALAAQDRIPEAKQSFRAAIDCDGHPCQAPSGYRQCIVDVAHQERVPLIDAADELSAVSTTGLLDRTVIHDNVHPTLRGYLTLGRAAAERAAALLVEEDSQAASVEPFDEAAFLAQSGFDVQDLATAYERIAFALEHFARQRYDESRRRSEAGQYRRWSYGLQTGAIQPGEQGTESLTQLQPGGVRLPPATR